MPGSYGQPSGHKKFKKKRRAAGSTVVVYDKPGAKRQIGKTQPQIGLRKPKPIEGAPERSVGGAGVGRHEYQEGRRVRRKMTPKEKVKQARRALEQHRARPRRRKLDINKPPLPKEKTKRKRDPGPEGDDPDDPDGPGPPPPPKRIQFSRAEEEAVDAPDPEWTEGACAR